MKLDHATNAHVEEDGISFHCSKTLCCAKCLPAIPVQGKLTLFFLLVRVVNKMLSKTFLFVGFLSFTSTALFAQTDPFGLVEDDPFNQPKKSVAKKLNRDDALAKARLRIKAIERVSLDAEEKIRAALATKTDLDFFDVPLGEAVEVIKDKHEINVQFDLASLDTFGVSTDDPITKSVSGITLRSALKLILNDLNLGYVIQDEVLLVTAADVAESQTTTELYDVSGIVKNYSGKEELPSVIKKIVSPESWTSKIKPGPQGEIVLTSFGDDRHYLIVKQNLNNHYAIRKLIAQLHEVVE